MKKQNRKREKVFYYSDEAHDDFAGLNIKTKRVDGSFKFIHKNPLWRLCSFLVYYFVAVPIVLLYVKLFLRVKFVNKKAVKKCKQKYFLYGNHTGIIDAFIPNIISLPKRNKIFVSPDTVSIKGIKTLVQMLGALPVPTDIRGMKKFLKAVEYYHKNNNITIYPEAHIWPYYTGVRAFSDSSFAYAVKYNAPVFAFFTAFAKPKGFLSKFRKANVTVFVSDAFYPDLSLPFSEAKKRLRDEVYNFMVEKSAFSTYEVYKYIKKEEKVA